MITIDLWTFFITAVTGPNQSFGHLLSKYYRTSRSYAYFLAISVGKSIYTFLSKDWLYFENGRCKFCYSIVIKYTDTQIARKGNTIFSLANAKLVFNFLLEFLFCKDVSTIRNKTSDIDSVVFGRLGFLLPDGVHRMATLGYEPNQF